MAIAFPFLNLTYEPAAKENRLATPESKNWRHSQGGPMPVDYIPRIREKYAQEGYPAYKWVVNTDPPPWQPLRRPLSASRPGLVASGGIYVTGQVAFHYK